MRPWRKILLRKVVARMLLLRKRGSHRAARLATLSLEAMGAAGYVYRPARHNDFGSGTGMPVLLLHGFGAPRRVLDVLERRLRVTLGVAVMSFHLPGLAGAFDRQTDMEAEAERLARKLERLCARHGVERFNIIGHSKGGMVARYMVARHAVGTRVGTLITLGSPFMGAPAALLGAITLGLVSRSIWQLLPFSRFVRNLYRLPIPSGTRMVSISSTHDRLAPALMCQVPVALAAPGMIHNYVVSGVGHTGLLVHRAVFNIIAHELTASTASRCSVAEE